MRRPQLSAGIGTPSSSVARSPVSDICGVTDRTAAGETRRNLQVTKAWLASDDRASYSAAAHPTDSSAPVPSAVPDEQSRPNTCVVVN